MGIDESGQYGGLGEVNHFHAGRRASAGCNGGDLVAFDDDHDVFDHLFALSVY